MNLSKNIIIGSRGSDLALWQSSFVKSELERLNPGIAVEIKIIKTTGDKIIDSPLSIIGGKGAFTAELEEALLRNEIDLAVHSLKDLPTVIEERLQIAAIPTRADVRDALLSKTQIHSLSELPYSAKVATGSLRRKSQLLSIRPDLRIVDIRGNVPTRVQKFQANDWDAMLLASAGLTRLSMQSEISLYLNPNEFIPAPGQGALAIQCRMHDEVIEKLIAPLNDISTSICTTAERDILAKLGGGCQIPIGAYATIESSTVAITACVVSPDGTKSIKHFLQTSIEELHEATTTIVEALLRDGADAILKAL